MAFYHRNTSEKRKEEILADLKLPLNCPGKKLLAVVATVSLGKLYTTLVALMSYFARAGF